MSVLKHLSVLLLLAHGICYCQDSTSTLENQVKAAYIYNFTKFVYWNTQPQINDSTPLTIAIIGDESIGTILESFSKTQGKVRPLLVKVITTNDTNLTGCDIVYIGKVATKKLPVLLKRIDNNSILTVSDISGFTAKGGMIGFYLDNGKVKIEINMTAVANAKLQISAKLLEVARLTRSGKIE
ncbi:MAG: YfiR family protein [Fibrobacterota bacterium]